MERILLQVYESLHGLFDKEGVTTLDHLVRCSQILKSEQDTFCVMEAMNNFINPCTTEDKDMLYCLSSGAPVPSNVENDILMSDEISKNIHKQFVQDRIIDKTLSFHVPVKKQNLTNFCKSSQNLTSPREGNNEHRNNCRKKRFGATCYTGTAA